MLDGISIIGLTPSALLLLAVLMVFTGRLIPKSTHDQTIKERDQWHEAYELQRTARDAADAQVRELMELAKTGTKVLEAVHQNSELSKSGDS